MSKLCEQVFSSQVLQMFNEGTTYGVAGNRISVFKFRPHIATNIERKLKPVQSKFRQIGRKWGHTAKLTQTRMTLESRGEAAGQPLGTDHVRRPFRCANVASLLRMSFLTATSFQKPYENSSTP